MNVRLKPLSEQTIVLTGASSGIGLVTARMAARRGARLVLAARSSEELDRLVEEIGAQGGNAIAVVADVSRQDEVERIAEQATQRFGGFDTWVNNAGVTIFGRIEDVPIEDARLLFETNFWGMVYGSLTAIKHLRERGGALINMGSVASDQALPLQGMYSATKHAVKGFTNALRLEVEEDKAPVSVTLIKPTSIATPLPRHARNYLSVEPTLPPPVYAPENVARAILHAAQHPIRDLNVGGGGGKLMTAAGRLMPRLMDMIQERTMSRQQKTNQPARSDGRGILDQPAHDLAERMQYPRWVRETSTYTQARMHPWLTTAAVLGAGLALEGLWLALRPSSNPSAHR